jgi:hypothetical protein
MTGTAQTPSTYYRPADVALMFKCSEWWVKEQARKRRIPYSWIGGRYLFTDEHIVEIVRLFEVRPADTALPAGVVRLPVRPSSDAANASSPTRLHARPPRRARGAGTPQSSAA